MTDEDKNLLELAAKAAGFETGWVIQGWNPLADDGDALRLAVRLKLKIVQSETATICFYGFACYVSESIESNGICRYAATRRAIVRAASSIGGKL